MEEKQYVYVAYGYSGYDGDACVYKVFATEDLAIKYRNSMKSHMFIDKVEIIY